MKRKQNFQTIAWFWDLYQRGRLDLSPSYQRRSVWNQAYRNYFIDTILLGYPAPAIFLYEEIDPDGRTLYHVIDGKQRLTTLFDFVGNVFPVSEQAEKTELREKYFKDLSDDVKREFWGYPFSVEYIPTDEEAIINTIFDRINRNTAKLSAQELRHARFNGEFIQAAEALAEWSTKELGEGFPNIAARSRRQMKDVEFVAHLLLLLEKGAGGYSTLELDEAFSIRDEQWDARDQVEGRFRRVVGVLKDLCQTEPGQSLARSRLRNQADFYSLFGAIDGLLQEGGVVDTDVWRDRLAQFASAVDDDEARAGNEDLRRFFDAARSASNDAGPRKTRIDIIRRVLLGERLT